MIFVFRHPSTIVLSYSRLPVNDWCANNAVKDITARMNFGIFLFIDETFSAPYANIDHSYFRQINFIILIFICRKFPPIISIQLVE